MKTAHELGITEAQRLALLKVREYLAEEMLDHQSMDEIYNNQAPGLGLIFNMDVSCHRNACGTAACIGGWMEIFRRGIAPDADGTYRLDLFTEKNIRRAVSLKSTGSLAALFFPNTDRTADEAFPKGIVYDRITSQQAVAAIDNFLRDGAPNWGSALTVE